MLKDKDMQLSIYSVLYNRIPENHIFRVLRDEIDFSFINKELENTYSKYYGRPAKEPELMVKLLVLQRLYDLSDERVIEEASLNLAHMYFLGINPEDELPHPSLLAKFRKNKLEDTLTIDEIIVCIVNQCVEKGILKGTGISIDTTHTEANTFKCTSERVMKRLAKKIFRTMEKEEIEVPEGLHQDIPNYKSIEDPKEAKETMKSFLEETIKTVEENIDLGNCPKTKEIIANAKEILEDPKFLVQKGVRSLVDQDARVGHKSKTSHFFGYKTEFMMTTEDRIITAVHVGSGAYVDGTKFEELLYLTQKSGVTIEEVYGDKAYFRKPILDNIREVDAKAYIPVSEMAYRIDEDLYSYNKDSDEWFCIQGNQTVKKVFKTRKNGRQTYRYYFEKEKCRTCPLRAECIKDSTVGRILEVGINTPEFYGYSQDQKTDEFKEKYKNRACHEWKNGEMKNFHGLDRAKGYGLKSMALQAKLTALAVNLKRIAAILSSKKASKVDFSITFSRFIDEIDNLRKICA
ncbi:IS1182 family transposase [Ureibacillus composti]|uniref:IS1182 family transposase n=1 Tax=Lysinibacillus composti TaxID=720633 RepID=A0A3N9UG71_9BACI|nr:IS1182 family transposase [Lysinibacillus composti]MBM7610757.1 transposase [Lysinibacillus composti]MDM5334866.1 IS1182 family transposase [Ureibacillus composti]RQW70512.1 IS1182 family transposase [Lysinibacillus composti]